MESFKHLKSSYKNERLNGYNLKNTNKQAINSSRNKNRIDNPNIIGKNMELLLNNDKKSESFIESSDDEVLVNQTPKKKIKLKKNDLFSRNIYNSSSYELEESSKSEISLLNKKKKKEDLDKMISDNFYEENQYIEEDPVEIMKEGVAKIEKLAEKVKANLEKKIKKKNENKKERKESSLPQKFRDNSNKVNKKLSEFRELIDSNYTNNEYSFDLKEDDDEIAKIAQEIKRNQIFKITKEKFPKKEKKRIKLKLKSNYTRKAGKLYGRHKVVKEYNKTSLKRDISSLKDQDYVGYTNVAFHHCNHTIQEIAKSIDQSYLKVSRYLKEKTERKKRPKKLDNDHILFLKKTCVDKTNHMSTSRAVKLLYKHFNLKVNRETVRLELRKLGKIYKRRPIPKQTEDYEKKRLEFIDYLEKNNINGKDILFTDEKMFTFEVDSHKISRISPEMREKQKSFDKEANKLSERPEEKFPKKFMVAGGISWYGLTDLIFISGKMDGFAYVQSLSYYKRSMKRLNFEGFFQQDGAKVHDAEDSSKTFLKNFNLLQKWPASSPDISPIETVWAFLQQCISQYKVDNIHQLKLLVAYLWYKIPVQYCRSLINRFDHQIKWVKEHNGILYKEFFKKSQHRFEFDDLKALQPWKSYYNPFSVLTFSLEVSIKIRDEEIKSLMSANNSNVKKNIAKKDKNKDNFRYSQHNENCSKNKKMHLKLSSMVKDTSFQNIYKKRLNEISEQDSILDYILQRKFNIEDCIRMIGQYPPRPINSLKLNDPKDEDFDDSTLATISDKKKRKFDLNDFFNPGEIVKKDVFKKMLINMNENDELIEKLMEKTKKDAEKFKFLKHKENEEDELDEEDYMIQV